jgi:hypothetical protein
MPRVKIGPADPRRKSMTWSRATAIDQQMRVDDAVRFLAANYTHVGKKN